MHSHSAQVEWIILMPSQPVHNGQSTTQHIICYNSEVCLAYTRCLCFHVTLGTRVSINILKQHWVTEHEWKRAGGRDACHDAALWMCAWDKRKNRVFTIGCFTCSGHLSRGSWEMWHASLKLVKNNEIHHSRVFTNTFWSWRLPSDMSKSHIKSIILMGLLIHVMFELQ